MGLVTLENPTEIPKVFLSLAAPKKKSKNQGIEIEILEEISRSKGHYHHKTSCLRAQRGAIPKTKMGASISLQHPIYRAQYEAYHKTKDQAIISLQHPIYRAQYEAYHKTKDQAIILIAWPFAITPE